MDSSPLFRTTVALLRTPTCITLSGSPILVVWFTRVYVRSSQRVSIVTTAGIYNIQIHIVV
ncbi:hypothetical protein OH77DRAFT_458936 [Trametes cingulata]|nr:hypothetical protein OH77DRAFT_458936 [Trametes cingulata]